MSVRRSVPPWFTHLTYSEDVRLTAEAGMSNIVGHTAAKTDPRQSARQIRRQKEAAAKTRCEEEHEVEPSHYRFWPENVPREIALPRASVYHNLASATAREPDKTALIYYGSPLTYRTFKSEVDALAGFLQRRCGVDKGDRVLLFMQNSPQSMIAFYAILRADAMVVPVRSEERRV